MRLLHTSDWHVGKRLGRYDRTADHHAALDAIVDTAERQRVDLVIVSGDLFDRAVPPIDALQRVLDTLERLARPDRPVVAIAGNHDGAPLFELLAPLMRPHNVHLVGAIRPPENGGILTLDGGGTPVAVGCLPFLKTGHVVDFLREVDAWRGSYGARMAALCEHYIDALARQPAGTVTLLTAHFTVRGVQLGPARRPGTLDRHDTGQEPMAEGAERLHSARGERALTLGETYMVEPDAFGGGPQYVAMGHIHTPQAVPGSSRPAAYAGSPIELDFGEAGERKQVVIVDLEPGGEAQVQPVPITAGRRLVRAEGDWPSLLARHALRDAYVELTVDTDGPDPGLADRARDVFPFLVKVRARYARQAHRAPRRGHQPWDHLFADYFRQRHETEPPAALLDAFREILAEADDAST